jgi:hypothetical protein
LSLGCDGCSAMTISRCEECFVNNASLTSIYIRGSE